MKSRIIPVALFVVAVIVNLGGLAAGLGTPASVAKCFLMPLLCLSGLMFISGRKTRALYALALAMHTLGDIFLIFGGNVFFMAGMGSFFIGHIFYLLLFQSFFRDLPTAKKALYGFLMSFAMIFGAVAVREIMKLEPPMALPVSLYAAALIAMTCTGLFAFFTFGKDWWPVFAGALVFIVSDSLIGIDMFLGIDFPLRGVAVMATYITAQVLLTVGIVKLCGK